MVHAKQNILLHSLTNRPFLADVYSPTEGKGLPVVIFCHGFKGFKDWGPFNAVAEQFAGSGFVFVKFNFSHNGTTVSNPTSFEDLEAFGNNNMSIEMDDLGVVIDWVNSPAFTSAFPMADASRIYLLGHSRGGGIALLKANEDPRVKKVCTWASVNEFGRYWKKDEMEKIKQDGVIYIPNSRTGQQMPLYWQLYENYFNNLDRLHIPTAVKKLQIPLLIIHGTDDETVPYAVALEMHGWNNRSRLLLIEHGNHNFGGKHPWNADDLPEDLKDVIQETVSFFKE